MKCIRFAYANFSKFINVGKKKAEHQSGEINERNPLGENSLIKPSGTEEEKTPGSPTQNAVILHFIVWLKMINKKKEKKILAITN